MKRLLSLLAAAGLAGATAGCGDPSARWERGGIYSVTAGSDGFAVVKVLAIDPDAVSLRIYRGTFPHRPASVDPSQLTLGSLDDPEGAGVGHIPLAPREFAFWFPVQLGTQPVGEEELDGYRMWRESGGGVFDFDSLEQEAQP